MRFLPCSAVFTLATLAVLAAADPAPPAGPGEEWFLAVGHGGHRMLSKDGKAWEKHFAWGQPKHDQNDLNVAAHFKGAFFAGGGYFSGRLTATRDGKAWSDGVIPGSSPGLRAGGVRRHPVRDRPAGQGVQVRRRRGVGTGRQGRDAVRPRTGSAGRPRATGSSSAPGTTARPSRSTRRRTRSPSPRWPARPTRTRPGSGWRSGTGCSWSAGRPGCWP